MVLDVGGCPGVGLRESIVAELDLRMRRLGRAEMEITTVGLGAWAMGGPWRFGWGAQDDEQSIETIKHAVDAGVNWLDTAAAYGLGHSEEVVGRALREIPASERPFVFTKCGQINNPERPFDDSVHNLNPASMRRELEASLRRLRIDVIDLYQFHWPDDTGVPVEDSWAALTRLVAEGKVRAAGVCNFDAALLGRCEAVRHVDSLQPPFSMIRRDVAARELPWCAVHGTGVIAYSPMQSGLLTDAFDAARVAALAPDDWRRRSPALKPPKLEQNLALRGALRPIARRHGTTTAAVAVAWDLAWPGLSGAIVGARAPEQIDGWIRAATLALTPSDLDEIAFAIARTGAGSGPARP